MPLILLETEIAAPRHVVFDVARNIDLHPQTIPGTRERVVARGVDALLEAGDIATLEAVHFGVRQRLTVRITEMTAPDRFTDELVKGAFRKLIHRHEFHEAGLRECVMLDHFEFESPFGVLGRLTNSLFLTRYMRRLLAVHAAGVKAMAEARLPAKRTCA